MQKQEFIVVAIFYLVCIGLQLMIIFLLLFLLIIHTINRLIVWLLTILRMMTETLNNRPRSSTLTMLN